MYTLDNYPNQPVPDTYHQKATELLHGVYQHKGRLPLANLANLADVPSYNSAIIWFRFHLSAEELRVLSREVKLTKDEQDRLGISANKRSLYLAEKTLTLMLYFKDRNSTIRRNRFRRSDPGLKTYA